MVRLKRAVAICRRARRPCGIRPVGPVGQDQWGVAEVEVSQGGGAFLVKS